MGQLDGTWDVQRVSGALPPMVGVRKQIDGEGGHTVLGRLPFRRSRSSTASCGTTAGSPADSSTGRAGRGRLVDASALRGACRPFRDAPRRPPLLARCAASRSPGSERSRRSATTRPSTWQAAVAGESGIDFIRSFDASGFPVRSPRGQGLRPGRRSSSPKEARRLERNVLLALAAAQEALARTRASTDFDPARVGIVFGSAIGGLIGIMEQADVLRERGADRVSPFFLPSVLVDSASGQLAISLGIRGPNYAAVSACATGSHASARAPS